MGGSTFHLASAAFFLRSKFERWGHMKGLVEGIHVFFDLRTPRRGGACGLESAAYCDRKRAFHDLNARLPLNEEHRAHDGADHVQKQRIAEGNRHRPSYCLSELA